MTFELFHWYLDSIYTNEFDKNTNRVIIVLYSYERIRLLITETRLTGFRSESFFALPISIFTSEMFWSSTTASEYRTDRGFASCLVAPEARRFRIKNTKIFFCEINIYIIYILIFFSYLSIFLSVYIYISVEILLLFSMTCGGGGGGVAVKIIRKLDTESQRFFFFLLFFTAPPL